MHYLVGARICPVNKAHLLTREVERLSARDENIYMRERRGALCNRRLIICSARVRHTHTHITHIAYTRAGPKSTSRKVHIETRHAKQATASQQQNSVYLSTFAVSYMYIENALWSITRTRARSICIEYNNNASAKVNPQTNRHKCRVLGRPCFRGRVSPAHMRYMFLSKQWIYAQHAFARAL